jgi:hypothetical protein
MPACQTVSQSVFPTRGTLSRLLRRGLLACLFPAAMLVAVDALAQPGAAGVMIDARGVLRTTAVADAGLSAAHRKAAVTALPGDLQKPSALRKVALSRLDAELAAAIAGGRGIPPELTRLAGLTRVQYVFVYPATENAPGEVVLAGPAEPWLEDATGRVIGAVTGSPIVLLEDLAAAIRCFAPGQPQDRLIGCSIDPRPAGLKAMQEFLAKTGRINPQAGVDQIVQGLRESLGPQQISVQGVSPATHYARVLVEADYRMKLIGIGLERPPVAMKSWVDLAAGGAIAANGLQRWYFVPDYQCLRIAEDDLAVEVVGRGVKLCCADEVVLPDGRRLDATRASGSAKQFADTFTRKYAELAAQSPVFGQLRNLIDLAVAAAYMQEHDAFGKAGWSAATLRDEARYPIETGHAPTEVEPAVHAVWKGARLLTPIGGGVTMHPRMALDAPNLLMDEKGEVNAARTAAATLPAGRWWWD